MRGATRHTITGLAAVVGIGVAAACSSGPSKADTTKASARSVVTSSEGEIALPNDPYTPASVSGVGRITGLVPPTEVLALDSTAHECAGSADTSPRDTTDNGDAVVWLSGISQGKPPTSEKRTEIISVNCELEPRVQSLVAGTTVDVFNDDHALHRLVFTRLGTNDTITVMPFTNAGEIVPSEKLAKTPGVIEVHCKQHPWTHGYITVFDNPYFAVADRKGRFEIDSVPAGHYTLNTWVPGWKAPRAQPVDVSADGTLKLQLN